MSSRPGRVVHSLHGQARWPPRVLQHRHPRAPRVQPCAAAAPGRPQSSSTRLRTRRPRTAQCRQRRATSRPCSSRRAPAARAPASRAPRAAAAAYARDFVEMQRVRLWPLRRAYARSAWRSCCACGTSWRPPSPSRTRTERSASCSRPRAATRLLCARCARAPGGQPGAAGGLVWWAAQARRVGELGPESPVGGPCVIDPAAPRTRALDATAA